MAADGRLLSSAGDKVLRRLIGVVLLSIGLTVATGGWLYFEGRRQRAVAVSALLHQQAEKVSRQFDEFFQPMLLDLLALRGMGARGVLKIDEPGEMSNIILPILGKYPRKLSGFTLADEDGGQLKLVRTKGQWEFVPSESDPRLRPWFHGAVEAKSSHYIYWTPVYMFPTRKQPGISVSAAYSTGAEKILHVVEFDILLGDIVEFVGTLDMPAESRLFLIYERQMVDFSRLVEELGVEGAGAVPAGGGKDPVREATISVWEKRGEGAWKPRSFAAEGERWWVDFVPFDYGQTRSTIGLVVGEEHLLSRAGTPLLVFFFAMLAVLVVLVVLLAVLVGKRIRAMKEAMAYRGHAADSAEEITRVIEEGENDRLEFKSTLRWNLKANRPGKEIELACLKTIAAFLNCGGGTLLVGVEDEGSVVGIEADRFVNEDKFLLHFNNLIKQHIGLKFTKFISFALKRMEDRTILVVDCGEAEGPVFVRYKDEEDFYVRVGPGTRKLSTSEALEYISTGQTRLMEK